MAILAMLEHGQDARGTLPVARFDLLLSIWGNSKWVTFPSRKRKNKDTSLIT
jgi:hypothetical protein